MEGDPVLALKSIAVGGSHVKKATYPNRAAKRGLCQRIWDARMVYLFLLPGILYLTIFRYIPISSLTLAFRNYNAKFGVWGSPWVGLDNFQRLFITPRAITSILNTLCISFGRILFEFPVPILIAILFNEMPGKRVKKLYQTAVTFPHFLSWIVVATILQDFFGTYGVVNYVLKSLGFENINFLTNKSTFRMFVYFSANWKEMGWSSILFIASLAGINNDLYEAASIDGASRLRRIWHVTLPGLRPTIATMLILQIGNSMNGGFEQIFSLRNPVVTNVVDIIDTYVYDITFKATPNYGFSTAVGLFKSAVNCVLLCVANYGAKVLFGQGLFGEKR